MYHMCHIILCGDTSSGSFGGHHNVGHMWWHHGSFGGHHTACGDTTQPWRKPHHLGCYMYILKHTIRACLIVQLVTTQFSPTVVCKAQSDTSLSVSLSQCVYVCVFVQLCVCVRVCAHACWGWRIKQRRFCSCVWAAATGGRVGLVGRWVGLAQLQLQVLVHLKWCSDAVPTISIVFD